MAGTNSSFDAAAFRDAIRSAMRMGAPGQVADRATFRWRPVRTYSRPDSAGLPYNFNSNPVTEVVKADVVLQEVAIEFTARPAGTRDTAVGQFDTSSVVLTLLDDQYELVEGANEVLIGGNTYVVNFVAPPMALFEVDVYQIYCEARDES